MTGPTTGGHVPPPGAPRVDGRQPSPWALELTHLTGEAPGAVRAPQPRDLLDHRPGPMPLRPLLLREVMDVAFSVLRHAPGATIGASVVAAALSVALPAVLVVVAGLPGGDWADAAPDAGLVAVLESGTVLLGGAVLSLVGTVLVGGVVAHVVHAAVLGRLIGLDEAWSRTRGRRLAVLGVALLLGALTLGVGVLCAVLFLAVAAVGSDALVVVLGLLVVPLALVALLWVTVRLGVTTVPAVVIERVGVVAGLRRSLHLTRRSSWRLLGTLLVVGTIATVAAYLLVLPLVLLGAVAASAGGAAGAWVETAVVALTTVLPTALVSAYTSAVAAVLYLDLRIRTEGYDVQLRAGVEGRA